VKFIYSGRDRQLF